MNKAIFITGTDTGVGKTVITGLLGGYLLAEGASVVTQKWVQTGCGGFSEDIERHHVFMGLDRARYPRKYHADMAPYVFKFPSSPHLAAELEGDRIDTKRIKSSFRNLCRGFDIVLVEGAGGIMVPFSDTELTADVVGELGIPVLIVAANRLGAINQTVLTVEALKRRGVRVSGVIFNRTSREGEEIVLRENVRITEAITGTRVLGELPFSEDIKVLRDAFPPIGEAVLRDMEAS